MKWDEALAQNVRSSRVDGGAGALAGKGKLRRVSEAAERKAQAKISGASESAAKQKADKRSRRAKSKTAKKSRRANR